MYSNWMNFGASLVPSSTPAGFGSPCVARPARSWRISSATALPKAPALCVHASHRPTAAGPAAATCGCPTQKSFPGARTAAPAKARAKPATSNASTTPCANAWDAACAGRFLFPSATECMNSLCTCSFISTTNNLSFNCWPLPVKIIRSCRNAVPASECRPYLVRLDPVCSNDLALQFANDGTSVEKL